MSCPPKRPYRQPALSEGHASERYFSVSEHVVRSHDDPLPRGQCKEMFASIIERLMSNNLAGALKASELLCRKHPGNNFYLIEYARQLIGANQLSKASSVIDDILSRNAMNIDALKMQGFIIVCTMDNYPRLLSHLGWLRNCHLRTVFLR